MQHTSDPTTDFSFHLFFCFTSFLRFVVVVLNANPAQETLSEWEKRAHRWKQFIAFNSVLAIPFLWSELFTFWERFQFCCPHFLHPFSMRAPAPTSRHVRHIAIIAIQLEVTLLRFGETTNSSGCDVAHRIAVFESWVRVVRCVRAGSVVARCVYGVTITLH